MVRRASAGVALLAALAGATPDAVQAQQLQRLTVESFVLATDAAKPKMNAPFHLVLTLRVRQRVAEIDNLDLPMLAQLEVLGDERETTTGAGGTRYRETITVAAHTGDTIGVAPATLQAIDARDGKAKEWFTNPLTLRVAGPSALSSAGHVLVAELTALLWLLLWLLLWVLGIGCAATIVLVLFARRRRVGAKTPITPPALPIRNRSRREQAEDALAVLRAERTRSAAAMVRAAIWRMVGASDGETLGDVLQRPGSDEEKMRELLIALERSAFTYESDLRAAIEDACSSLERYIGSAA